MRQFDPLGQNIFAHNTETSPRLENTHPLSRDRFRFQGVFLLICLGIL